MKKQMFLFAATVVFALAFYEKPDFTGDLFSDELSILKSSSISFNESNGTHVLTSGLIYQVTSKSHNIDRTPSIEPIEMHP